MSVYVNGGLDMSAALLRAYELGDMILASVEAADYWRSRKALSEDAAAQVLIERLNKQKNLYEECQRFGRFHPEYHKAMDAVKAVETELDALESVRSFKEAEDRLDQLLYDVSRVIASSVSDSIKVSSNRLMEKGCGCSSGGSCSGSCG